MEREEDLESDDESVQDLENEDKEEEEDEIGEEGMRKYFEREMDRTSKETVKRVPCWPFCQKPKYKPYGIRAFVLNLFNIFFLFFFFLLLFLVSVFFSYIYLFWLTNIHQHPKMKIPRKKERKR